MIVFMLPRMSKKERDRFLFLTGNGATLGRGKGGHIKDFRLRRPSLPSGPTGGPSAPLLGLESLRTRKVVQIVLEVPVEEADAAYQVLGGMPNPAESFWCAVAGLQPDSLSSGRPPTGSGDRGTARPAKKKQSWMS